MAKKLMFLLAIIVLILPACASDNQATEESIPKIITGRPAATTTVKSEATAATVIEKDPPGSTGTSAPSQNTDQFQPGVLLSESRSDLEWVFVIDAVNEGLVELTISGNGLDKIDITIKPQVDFSFGVGFIPGLMFLTSSAGIQPMVLVELREVVLEPGITLELELEVNCADMDLEAPGAGNKFTIAMPSDPALSRLAWAISESQESFRVNQFAVWIVTNGRVRNIASSNLPGTGPSDDEWDRVAYLFELAEVPLED